MRPRNQFRVPSLDSFRAAKSDVDDFYLALETGSDTAGGRAD